MNTALYALIAATYAQATKIGSKSTDTEWYVFQDAVHGFWSQASDLLEAAGAGTDHPDFLIATAVDAQLRVHLKITREVPAQG